MTSTSPSHQQFNNDSNTNREQTQKGCFFQRCSSGYSKGKCKVQRVFDPLFKGKVWLIEKFEDLFESFGHYVFDHPWRFIIIPTLICLICSLGFFRRVPELDMELLYSLPVSPTAIAKTELNRVFPIERIQYVFVSADNEGELLSATHLEHLDQFWKKVTALKVPRALAEKASIPGDISVMSDWLMENDPDLLKFDPGYATSHPITTAAQRNAVTSARSEEDMKEFIRLEDVCIREFDGQCKMVNPLELYATPKQWGKPLRTSRYPTLINFKTAKGYRIDSMLGAIIKDVKGSTTSVYNATAAAFRLDLNGNVDKVTESAAWEQALIAVIENMRLPGLKLYVRVDRSLSDELAQSCQLKGEDLIMLVCAALFVFAFTVSMNSSCDRYRSKWLPAAVGVISTLLAYGGGVGLCHLLGYKHVPPSESTPFILLGIGVDDVFVIANAYSLTYLHSSDARTRLGLSFRDAGISVTITTVTNILAFAVGASSVYYSIHVFCIVTAAGLIAGYILCLTLFAAVLSLDAVAEQKYRSVPLWESDISTVSVSVRSLDNDSIHDDSYCENRNGQLPSKDATCQLTDSSTSALMTADPTPKTTTSNHQTESRSPSEPPSTASSAEKLLDDDDCDSSRDGVSPSSLKDGNVPSTRSRTPRNSPFTSESSRNDPQQCPSPSVSPSPSLQSLQNDSHPKSLDGANREEPGTPKSCRFSQRLNKSDKKKKTTAWPFGVESGFFAVEELDGHLVVAERVAEMCQKNKKKRTDRKLAKERNVMNASSKVVQCGDTLNGHQSVTTADSNNEDNDPDDRPVTSNSLELMWLEDEDDDGIEMTPHHSSMFNNNHQQNEIEQHGNRETPNAPEATPIVEFDLSTIPRLVQVQQKLIPIETINFKEPHGTVGKGPRYFFMHYYGPFLMQPIVKAIVLLAFLALVSFTAYNATTVEAGLKVRDITPYGSYLRDFYDVREKYFAAYGDECVVFFPDGGRWWDADVQRGILQLTESIRQSDHVVFVLNGFEDFLAFVETKTGDNNSSSTPTTEVERQQFFVESLKEFMETPRGLTYQTTFTIENGVLTSWKFYYWMKFQDNTLVAIRWFQEIQGYMKDFWNKGLFEGHVFTPLAVMWESDPVILGSTLGNMAVALISMGVIASLLIPDFKSGLLVLLVIIMIDLDVYAFMPVWDLNLNMLTMVNLVLSIGFAVDYTAHITHCFNHCKGKTRDRRVIETLLLMGLPVSEGMISTYAAVGLLSFSHKYALVVVFRMVTLVMAFAFTHGVILMPVVLSLIGPMDPREVDVVEIRDGIVVSTWTVDGSTGQVLNHLLHYSHHHDQRRDWINQASVASVRKSETNCRIPLQK